MVCSRPNAVVLVLSTALVLASRFATAQEEWKGCDNGHRDPTAAEAKAYHDGYALFQRMAPPTPASWTAEDSHLKDHITWVCVTRLLDYQRWHFTRTFKLGQGQVDARAAVMMKKTQALMAKREARGKANAAKLADIERRQAQLAKRTEAAVAQNNFAALSAISTENDKLAAEREALSTDSSLDAEQKAIGAEFDRDNIATYELIFGATDARMSSDFKPMASAVGKGYRQDYEDKSGNPYATLAVVLPPVPGASRQTIVQTSGDPARAQALLNDTKLR